jgi:hypothetical protein
VTDAELITQAYEATVKALFGVFHTSRMAPGTKDPLPLCAKPTRRSKGESLLPKRPEIARSSCWEGRAFERLAPSNRKSL